MDLLRNSILTFIILNVCLLFGIGEADLIHRRRPRAILQFSAMIECATGRSAWEFKNYGCWCGLRGGGTPVDEVDACCRLHDECYDALKDDGICPTYSLYFSSYLFQRRHCQEVDQPSITCSEGTTPCRRGLCDCDREAALCMANARFTDEYRDYNRDSCLP